MKDNYYNHDILTKEHTYLSDLSEGTLKIWDVPQEHRTGDAYNCAMYKLVGISWMSGDEKKVAFLEKKIIEKLLLDDIMKSLQEKDSFEKTRDLRMPYFWFFCPESDGGIPVAYEEHLSHD